MKKEDIAYIMNVLRAGTVKWSGRKACLRRARKKVIDRYHKKTGAPIYKLMWQCFACKEWYSSEKKLEVDHVTEIGGFSGDWNDIIGRMYPHNPQDQSVLQALCLACHKRKTLSFMNARLNFKRKK